MTRTGIGIIGAGRIGRIHCENLLRMQNVSVKAVTDPYMDRQWAENLGINVVVGMKDILDNPAIDAVFIQSPSTLHASQIIESAKAGKHIFCEKPVALDPGTIREALAAVNQAGVKLQIGFNRRFDPSFSRLREAYADGRIGNLVTINIISRDPAPPSPDYVKNSGGIFLDMTIHDFDMVRFLSGSEVVEVFARGGILVDERIGRAGDLDTAVTTMTLDNGALAVIENCRKAVYGYDQRIEVFGTKGSIRAGNRTETSTVLITDKGSLSDRPMDFFLERYAESYKLEAEEFIEAVREDRDITVGGQAGLEAIYIGLAAGASIARNRPVKVTEIRGGFAGK